MKALMDNWNNCAYCLFPCESNWIYSGCNLMGMQGALAYDSYKHTGQAAQLLQEYFHRQFEREFMNPDDSIVALRSAITGFPIPGLAGVLGDVGGAISCMAAMPLLARRLWHISRNSTARKDSKTGKLTLDNLGIFLPAVLRVPKLTSESVGADNMDVGCYQTGPGFAWSIYAPCAGEFGEEDLKRDLLEKIDAEIHPVEPHNRETGSLKNKDFSLLGSGFLFRARLTHEDDGSNLVNDDIAQNVLTGPKLSDVPFPAVLVAKFITPNGKDLDIVLYSSLQVRTFKIKFQNLVAGVKYTLNEKIVVAAKTGEVQYDIYIDRRTQISLKRVSN